MSESEAIWLWLRWSWVRLGPSSDRFSTREIVLYPTSSLTNFVSDCKFSNFDRRLKLSTRILNKNTERRREEKAKRKAKRRQKKKKTGERERRT
jgi:hypothetical protein